MSPGINYRESPPLAALRQWVECSWELGVDLMGPAHRHRVLPDGCIDLVWTQDAGLRVAGPNTTAFVASVAAGTGIVGVRFRPGGAPPVFGVFAAALLDALIRPGDLWGAEGARLEEAVNWAAPQDRTGAMIDWISSRALGAAPRDPVVRAVADRLAVEPVNVRTLATDLGYSERHLHRRVVQHVGYGPKHLARVLRLQRALALARGGRHPNLAEVASAAGYSDQAHLVHESQSLGGATPTELLTV